MVGSNICITEGCMPVGEGSVQEYPQYNDQSPDKKLSGKG